MHTRGPTSWLFGGVVLVAMTAIGAGCATDRSGQDDKVRGRPPPNADETAIVDLPAAPSSGERPPSEPSSAGDGEADEPPSNEAERPVPDGAESVRRAEIARLARRGPSYLFQVSTLHPVRRDGTFRGFEIADLAPVARRALAPQMEVGDVVVAINGRRIDAPDDVHELWRRLAELSRIEITFLRNGERRRAVWIVEG